MKIQIYIPSESSRIYLPFMLVRGSIYNIIKNNICDDIDYVYDDSKLDVSSNSIIIVDAYGLQHDINGVISTLKNGSCKVIIINTEFYQTGKSNKTINNFDYYNDRRFYLLEYNPLNYKYFKLNKPNINIFYIPLLYNPFLEHVYSNIIKSRINLCDKDIDILFYGSLNKRRKSIIKKLKQKYIVVSINNVTNDVLINYINRSKIILNIFFYDNNSVFDYYRNAFLLANKIFFISEKPSSIDLNIEKNLENYDTTLILSSYDKITETVDYYLSNYDCQNINEIIEKQYNWFKKHDLSHYITDLFKQFTI